MTQSQQPLCLYHGSCLDGFGAAWAVNYALHGDVELVPCTYGEDPPSTAGRDVLMVDFAYKWPVMERIGKEAHSLLVLDHHVSAQDDLEPIDIGHPDYINYARYAAAQQVGAVFDMARSGAGIAWDTLVGETRPLLLNYVEDRDLWRFALPHSREVHAGLASWPLDLAEWSHIIRGGQAAIVALGLDGVALERKARADIAMLLPIVRRRMVIGGYDVPVANMPITMTSDAGALMAVGEPFAACYWDTPNGRVFSLRSNPDGLDVSKVAVLLGGGGHPHASGFTMPRGWEGDEAPSRRERA